ncbi:MAG TPA: hypothetical protein VFM68_02045 [Candidatus Saccharimonadales bacterium]|nr:hypothetical protein [Candidatus Saccharimonadales bacterium]
MKKNILIILSITLVAAVGWFYYAHQPREKVVSNETQSTTKQDVRKAVWEHLPADRQELTKSTWKDAKVQQITLDGAGNITGELVESYVGTEVYMVDFTTTRKAIPNNIIVIADKDTFEIIGYGLVD